MMSGLISWSPGVSLEEIEKQVIIKAFSHYRQNKTTTSIAPGISIRTLDNKLERYAADAKAEEERLEKSRRSRTEQLARARGQVPQDTTASIAKKAISNGVPSNAGVRMESVANAPTESEVPLPKRAEIQEVLQRQTAQGGSRGRR